VNHDVLLRGFGGGGPLVLERTDQRFMDSTYEILRGSDPAAALALSAPDRDAHRNLRLYQPVHRTFNVALCEAVCRDFGEPRLDPAKIDSAGFVVRRVLKTNANKVRRDDPPTVPCDEAWIESASVLRGWLSIAGSEDLDPDPARRVQPFHAGQVEMQRLLERVSPAAPPMSESRTTLFPAPPEICAAIKKTVLLGVVQVSTLEAAEASPTVVTAAAVEYDDDEIDAQIPMYFKAGPARPLNGLGGMQVDRDWADSVSALTDAGNVDLATKVDKYVQFLRAVQIQLDLFGDSRDAVALAAIVGQLKVYYGAEAQSALDHLRQICAIVVNRQPGSVRMPDRWGGVTDQQAAALKQSARATLNRRVRAVLPPEGRFQDRSALYRLRAFMRVRRDDGCPPALVWSAPSAPFTIVPWHESGKLPPVAIALPEVTRDNVKTFKPNAAFLVPKTLFNFLQKNTPKNLLDGKAQDGGDLGIDWICGFNIPIITIVAFILLYIILMLLNIVFWWLPFIRICIPLPRKAKL
jgi:hypothetical protein